MLIRIIGELDSVDRAELAARSIRDNISGVSKINIVEKARNLNQSYYAMGVPYNSNQTSYYFMNVYDPEYNAAINSTPEIERGIEANLEIDCDEEAARQVIAQLHAHGGVKVRKLYGRR
ncbi:MAG: hypothetical protein GX346_06665 [Clostridiales bacterium]|nr:hypothetical protein [Clostridiales bacterium]